MWKKKERNISISAGVSSNPNFAFDVLKPNNRSSVRQIILPIGKALQRESYIHYSSEAVVIAAVAIIMKSLGYS